MKTKHHGQMSESFLTAVFLSLSGGLQDAYTYLFRGKVFANAQTGNIVLLSTNIMDGRWDKVLHYLVPLCAFALGVLAAEKMREHFQVMQRLHWRQLVVLGEVLLLFAVASAAIAEPAGQRHCFLLLRHAGTGFPQGERLRLCQYHVHRRPAQRRGGLLHLAQVP